MNEQITDAQPAVQANIRPLFVTIIAILTIIGSAITIFYILGLIIGLGIPLGSSLDPIGGIFLLLLFFCVPILSMIVAIKLLKMKKWALNTFLVILACLVIMNFIKVIDPMQSLFSSIIVIAMGVYLWKIRKQFN